MTRLIVEGATRSPFSRMFCSAWGKMFLRNSEMENLQSRMTRMHLMPPEVDPPHPPMNMSPKMIQLAATGHSA